MPVEVVAYSTAWPAQFEAVAATLRDALGDVPSARVEHVGSTSVPGLAAKPILDIDVIVEADDIEAGVVATWASPAARRSTLRTRHRVATSTCAARARCTSETTSRCVRSCGLAVTCGTRTPR